MNALDKLVKSVLQRALLELENAGADVYTFALHHDSEHGALSVCADTATNSRRVLRKINRQSMKRFAAAVRKRDLEEALVWQAAVGRNLAPRDFAWTDLARRSLGRYKRAPLLHATMLQSALQFSPQVAALTSDREALLFTCSNVEEEVGFVWTADAAVQPR